jgi:hypothetical protein
MGDECGEPQNHNTKHNCGQPHTAAWESLDELMAQRVEQPRPLNRLSKDITTTNEKKNMPRKRIEIKLA